MEQLDIRYTLPGYVKLYKHFGKEFYGVKYIIAIRNSTPKYSFMKNKNIHHKIHVCNAHSTMLNVHNKQSWKQTNYSSTREWIKIDEVLI